MPNSYSDDSIWRYDVSKSLDIISYYFLVFFSFTGLCTLLGMTETVEIQEFISNDNEKTKSIKKNLNYDDDLCVWFNSPSRSAEENDIWKDKIKKRKELQSKLDPSIEITQSVFEYMQRHIEQHDNRKQQQNPKDVKIHLARKFEYHFRLIDLHVIMLHFISTSSNTSNNHDGNADDTDDYGEQTLHLVEVYKCKNIILRHWLDVLLGFAGKVMRFVCGTTKPIQGHAKVE